MTSRQPPEGQTRATTNWPSRLLARVKKAAARVNRPYTHVLHASAALALALRDLDHDAMSAQEIRAWLHDRQKKLGLTA